MGWQTGHSAPALRCSLTSLGSMQMLHFLSLNVFKTQIGIYYLIINTLAKMINFLPKTETHQNVNF